MRFVVFGGGGDMGSRVVEELAVTPGVELITIVGRTRATMERAREDARAAQTQVAKAGIAPTPPATPTAATQAPNPRGTNPVADIAIEIADARDRDTVIDLMRRHDVALGALGPFYIFEEPMVEAAIAAGTPYISLCDDADATAAALEYDSAARAAGVTIITGLGWTPGLTNLLAVRAAARLDKAHSVTIAWTGSAAESGGSAVALHTLHIFNGDVITYTNGRHVHVPAGTESEYIDFPAPLGRVRVCHVGHPEPLTLPEQMPGVRQIALKGGLVEPTLHQLAVLTGRLGLARTHRRRTFLAGLLVPLIPFLSRLGPKRPAISGVVVRVTGEKDGRAVTVESAATAPMKALTGVPMAVGAVWLARGRIKRPGVLAPDAPDLLHPDQFLDELARRGVHITDTMHTI